MSALLQATRGIGGGALALATAGLLQAPDADTPAIEDRWVLSWTTRGVGGRGSALALATGGWLNRLSTGPAPIPWGTAVEFELDDLAPIGAVFSLAPGADVEDLAPLAEVYEFPPFARARAAARMHSIGTLLELDAFDLAPVAGVDDAGPMVEIVDMAPGADVEEIAT